LACGGIDAPENMQWQTIAEGKLKDRWELEGCGRPTILNPSASSVEPSTSSPTAESRWRGKRRDQRTGIRGQRSPTPARRHTANKRLSYEERLPQTGSWMQDQKIKARFIEPLLLERSEKLPQSTRCDICRRGFSGISHYHFKGGYVYENFDGDRLIM
jgi:hypothetical protein